MSEEQALQHRSSRPRLFQLDALRGLAALAVVANHISLAVPGAPSGWKAQMFSDGRAAVVLFFVLSGYVLSLPYWSGSQMPYGWYLLRRTCRIYLPFAAAAVLAIFCAYCFRNSSLSLTAWFNQTWHTPITPGIVAQQFLMVPMNDFNTAFWSLTYEMQMSIVMPLLCFVMLRTHPALFTFLLGFIVFTYPMDPYQSPQYPVLTWQILFLFVLGAAIAYYAAHLGNICRAMGPWAWLLPLASVTLYCFNELVIRLVQGTAIGNRCYKRIFLINGLGAAGIIICSLNLPPIAMFLKHSLPEYLGRISYSLYLVHGTVLFALIDILWLRTPTRWLLGLIVLAIIAAAHVFCIGIEEPSMHFGKWLCSGAKSMAKAKQAR